MTTRERHIVFVDDYPDALDVRALHLRAFGYRVSTNVDGAAALRKAERLIAATYDSPLIAAVQLHSSRFGGLTALSITSSVRQPSHIAGQSAQENG
jgi:CheY-like chemotaxis protein